jgi:hypothetical protein
MEGVLIRRVLFGVVAAAFLFGLITGTYYELLTSYVASNKARIQTLRFFSTSGTELISLQTKTFAAESLLGINNSLLRTGNLLGLPLPVHLQIEVNNTPSMTRAWQQIGDIGLAVGLGTGLFWIARRSRSQSPKQSTTQHSA